MHMCVFVCVCVCVCVRVCMCVCGGAEGGVRTRMHVCTKLICTDVIIFIGNCE